MRVNLPVTGREYLLRDGAVIVSKTDTKGRITYVNDDFIEASGFTEDELIGKAHNLVRHPDMPPEAFADLWRTLEAGRPWTGYVKNRRKDGDHYWVLANVTPIRKGAQIVEYMSVRSKPSREAVDACEKLYREFREQRQGRKQIVEGRAVVPGPRRWLEAQYRLPFGAQIGGAVAMLALPGLAALAWLATRGTLPTTWVAAAGVAVFAGAVSLWRATRRVSRTLEGSAEQVEALTQGDFDRIFTSDGDDALARLQRALQSLRTKVGFELVDSRRRAAEATRLRQALDRVSTNVVVADARNDVIYLNDVARETFARLEPEFRRVLPGFSAVALRGAKLETLAADAGAERSRLESLRGASPEDRTYGDAVFRTVASPVLDETGARIGTVMEWNDRSQEAAVEREVQGIVDAAGHGDLSRRVALDGKRGFFLALSTGLNAVLDGSAGILRAVRAAADEVSRGATEISHGNANLSERTEQQASSLEETAASMEQMTSTVKQNADSAARARELAAEARQRAERGGDVASRAVQAMQSAGEASRRIVDIIEVIDSIAFQTNLLALNAAVEAARAGDEGRGFAVVATEVRALAGRSAEAARQIKQLIDDSVQRVAEGSRLVDESGATLAALVDAVGKVNDIVAEIATASHEQSSGIDQVGKAVMQMDSVTQQNAALVEEATAAAESLMQQAVSLGELLAKYRVDEGEGRGADPGSRGSARPAAASRSDRRPARDAA
jgi:methyl-accepting chemotaxis protein